MKSFAFIIGLLLVAGNLDAQPRKITLSNAIQAALENNASVQIAEEQQVQADARRQEQRAALLPNVYGAASYTSQTINLGGRGIRIPGILPSTVGPFTTGDLRLQYTEPVLDFSLIRRYRSSRSSAAAADFDTQAVKNQVAAMVARIYFNVQRARAAADSVKAQIELDNSLLQLARDRQEMGTGTRLDVTRAESRMAGDRHRLLQTENEARTAQLQLLRAMGDRPNLQLELTDSLAASLLNPETADEAVAAAMRNRPEVKAEERKVEASRLTRDASKAERYPAVQTFADYGNNGNRQVFVPTNTVGVQLQVPLFDGGRRAAHRRTAESQARQVEVRAKDVRDEIELDVRVAADNLDSSREQLRASEEALNLAKEELDLARVRFEAQVTTQIDVVSAQAQLAEARVRQVNALFTLKSAELEYQRATGVEIR